MHLIIKEYYITYCKLSINGVVKCIIGANLESRNQCSILTSALTREI